MWVIWITQSNILCLIFSCVYFLENVYENVYENGKIFYHENGKISR